MPPRAALPFDLPSNLKQPQGYDTIPRVQTTLHDLTSRALFQADFSKFIAHFGGSHDLRIGVGRMKNVNNVDISYPGGGYVTLWWDTSSRIRSPAPEARQIRLLPGGRYRYEGIYWRHYRQYLHPGPVASRLAA